VIAGAVVTLALSPTARLLARVSAQEGTRQGPVYKVVLENDRVRVRDVTFAPGVRDNGMHTHQYPHVGVVLTKGTLVFTDPAGKVDSVPFEAGTVGFREAEVTHMVSNPGPDPMRVIEVELK
jgi:oxalate decarboxylase/phosphoglucose isomerase-like protein (cupin superfamily)